MVAKYAAQPAADFEAAAQKLYTVGVTLLGLKNAADDFIWSLYCAARQQGFVSAEAVQG